MADRMPLNGATVRWARSRARLGLDELAKAAGIKVEVLEAIEAGAHRPTLRQALALANKLDRPVGFFLLPPPEEKDPVPAADFRGRAGGVVPPELVAEIRRAERYREVLLDLEQPPRVRLPIGPVTLGNVDALAEGMRTLLGLERHQLPSGDERRVLSFWRGLLETRGILVFQASAIPTTVFRGVSIYHDVAPVVVLNGADGAAARTFSLFHEVGHLINRDSGMCMVWEDNNSERMANEFAAHFLMPTDVVRVVAAEVPRGSDVEHGDNAIELVWHVARKLRVSGSAAAVRLAGMGLVPDSVVGVLLRQAAESHERQRNKMKRSGGGPRYATVKLRNLGDAYVGAVARALEDSRIDILDASHMMDARVPAVEQIIAGYYARERRQ